jgi:hypothetical protein
MKESMSFVSENIGFIIAIIAIACILFGRVWSNILNWGEITDPQLVIKKGKYYKVINLYLPKNWTEDWVVGSIICLEGNHRKFFVKYRKEIYVSGDRIRFSDDGPAIGLFYQAIFPKTANGSIVMKPVNMPTQS